MTRQRAPLRGVASASLLAIALLGAATTGRPERDQTFGASEADIERLLEYNRAITLTAEQEKVRVDALGPLPAPCCSQFSAATCCCECNLTRATWGLAKHLIAERGLAAEAVREAVRAWHATVNPSGFSGRSCFTGGCARPFVHDGCGGMHEDRLVR